MFSLTFAALLLLSTPVNVTENIDDLPRKHPLEEVVGVEKAAVAQEIETHLTRLGFSDRLARAATINAYAESKLNPEAVGDNGNSVGVFQLNSKGLGRKMTHDDRKDVRKSAERIAWFVHKDKKLISMQEECAHLKDLVAAFTIRIERPSNAKKKALVRAKLSDRFDRGLSPSCSQKS